jgi:hypothetical protein
MPKGARSRRARPDAQRICPGVKPGGGKLIGCLKGHENDVTIGCVKELKAIKSKMGKDRSASIRRWIG